METPLKFRDLSFTITISCRISIAGPKLSTVHVSPQLHAVFDDEFSTVPFVMEGTIIPNWTVILQRISQGGASENIDLKYSWFSLDLEEYAIKTPSHEPRFAPENNKNMIQQIQESPDSKGA